MSLGLSRLGRCTARIPIHLIPLTLFYAPLYIPLWLLISVHFPRQTL